MPPGGATFYNQPAGFVGGGNSIALQATGYFAMNQQQQQHQHLQQQQHHQHMATFQGKQKRWGSPNVPQKRHLAGSPPRASYPPQHTVIGELVSNRYFIVIEGSEGSFWTLYTSIFHTLLEVYIDKGISCETVSPHDK